MRNDREVLFETGRIMIPGFGSEDELVEIMKRELLARMRDQHCVAVTDYTVKYSHGMGMLTVVVLGEKYDESPSG